MSLNNLTSNPFIMPNMEIDEETSLKSYNYNKYKSHMPLEYIIEENSDEFKFDISNLNYNNTNYISQDILTKNEIHNETEKHIFYIENTNKKSEVFASLGNIKENLNNNLEYNNTNNINNSKLIIEIKNNFNIEDTTEKPNKNFKIFSDGNNDYFSNNIIYEALNEGNKKRKKQKKNKRIFTTNTIEPKKKKKNIEHRKDNADNIRKKIKVRFHKVLQNIINENLKKAGSKYIFKALPQSFKTNVTIENNKAILDLPLKEILSIDNFNIFVLNYLEKNYEISEKSNFNKIKNMKYYEIYNEYLLSKEFKLVISSLKQKENDKYISNYICKANHLINFFRLEKEKKRKKEKK